MYTGNNLLYYIIYIYIYIYIIRGNKLNAGKSGESN